MRRSKTEIYLHFVWATYNRMPLVTGEIEPVIYACIQKEAERQDCEILAIGGMPDHIHLALKMPAKQSPARLMQCIKGVSSTFVRQHLLPGEVFGWQDNYGVFSLGRPHVGRVVAYIQNQKRHHAHGNLWPQWEETDEAVA